jgi:hypothetical protein
MQQAAQGQRQYENVDQQQIKRKEPDRPFDVGLIHVFDHDDLKLAGQENNRQPGEQNQRSPGTGAPGIEFKESAKISFGSSPLEQIAQAAEQAIGHKNADRHEGNQLDHRFKATAATMPSCRSVASRWRAEQDGKERQDDRDQEGRIQAQPLPLLPE